MKRYDTKDIRNIAIIGQRGAGKTSLAECLLFTSGKTTRLGSVNEETSVFDTEPEEIKRHSTIHAATAYAEWKKTKINILDAPGYANFAAEARAAQAAARYRSARTGRQL